MTVSWRLILRTQSHKSIYILLDRIKMTEKMHILFIYAEAKEITIISARMFYIIYMYKSGYVLI